MQHFFDLLRTRHRSPRGFTLIEILVVIGMLAILSTIVLVAVNPLRQFAQARNAQRQNDVAALLNAISERIADNGGTFPNSNDSTCPSLPTSATNMGDSPSSIAIRPCLVATYLAELPFDPTTGSNSCTDVGCSSQHYNLGYTVMQDPQTHRITVCAPGSAEPAITNSTAFCLTR